MWAAFLGFFSTLAGTLLKVFITTKSQGTKEAETAGAAEVTLTSQTEGIKEVEKIDAAKTVVSDAVATDNGLHQYEARDPNNRDA